MRFTEEDAEPKNLDKSLLTSYHDAWAKSACTAHCPARSADPVAGLHSPILNRKDSALLRDAPNPNP